MDVLIIDWGFIMSTYYFKISNNYVLEICTVLTKVIKFKTK